MSDNKKIDYIQSRIDSVADSVATMSTDAALQRAALENHTKQVEDMYEQLKRMNNILQKNTDSLKEHMHRTDLLEGIVVKMDERFTPIEVAHLENAAIKHWIYDKSKFVAKVGGAILAVAGVWVYVKPIITQLLLK